MSATTRLRPAAWALLVAAALPVAALPLHAQGGGGGAGAQDTPMRQANRLDTEGRTTEARVIFQRLIDSAATPAAKAAAQRAMAMSHAFDGDCANTVKYEQMVIAYWKTREQAEPQNAFYQQGEMANEAARVCIDAGDLDTAEKLVPHRLRAGGEGAGAADPSAHALGLPHGPRAGPSGGAPWRPRRGRPAGGGGPPDPRRRHGDGGAAGALLPLPRGLRGALHQRPAGRRGAAHRRPSRAAATSAIRSCTPCSG